MPANTNDFPTSQPPNSKCRSTPYIIPINAGVFRTRQLLAQVRGARYASHSPTPRCLQHPRTQPASRNSRSARSAGPSGSSATTTQSPRRANRVICRGGRYTFSRGKSRTAERRDITCRWGRRRGSRWDARAPAYSPPNWSVTFIPVNGNWDRLWIPGLNRMGCSAVSSGCRMARGRIPGIPCPAASDPGTHGPV